MFCEQNPVLCLVGSKFLASVRGVRWRCIYSVFIRSIPVYSGVVYSGVRSIPEYTGSTIDTRIQPSLM
eukprot:COSAG02_NODE_5462_length_4300_cov_3.302309_4_plen_68_part_00